LERGTFQAASKSVTIRNHANVRQRFFIRADSRIELFDFLQLMKLFGLTGGIGMGKSTCARLLAERGVPVIDTDILAHQLVQPGQPALEQIKNAFGEEMISATGQLRRDVLARKVFSDSTALRQLEAILHPPIRKLWLAETKKWREQGQSHGVVIIPLLFETDAQSEFDAVICVACSSATQLARLRERGWSDEQIQQRLASQWPVEKKIAQSEFVIWTDTSVETHAAQVERILETNTINTPTPALKCLD
jgi:dephospho-CoA kinase